MSGKHVLAVILNWNEAELTKTCCASLAAQTHRGLHVLVVDNGSTENSVDQLQSMCRGAEVVSTGANLGFAGGVNAGVRAAGSLDKYDYIWLLNNDTTCTRDALDRLLAKADANPRLAAIGCAMKEGTGEGKTERVVQPGKSLRSPFFIPREVKNVSAIDYVCGACMLIRKEALEDVGLLDESFFFFFEDADWCFRAKQKRWNFGSVDTPLVRHLGNGTVRKSSYNRAAYYRCAHVTFLRKHAHHPLLASSLVTGFRLLADLLQFNLSSARGTVAGFLKGWRK